MIKASELPGDANEAVSAITPLGTRLNLLMHECELVSVAKAVLLQRRQRLNYFKANMFGEEAWELLLQIYIREHSALSSIPDGLQSSSRVSNSVTGRWLRYLELEGLLTYQVTPSDQGPKFVGLSDQGRQFLEAYLEELLPKSLNR